MLFCSAPGISVPGAFSFGGVRLGSPLLKDINEPLHLGYGHHHHDHRYQKASRRGSP